jgi:hypothetical protein
MMARSQARRRAASPDLLVLTCEAPGELRPAPLERRGAHLCRIQRLLRHRTRLAGSSRDRQVPAVTGQDTGPDASRRLTRKGRHGPYVRPLRSRSVPVDPAVACEPFPANGLQHRVIRLLERRFGQGDRTAEVPAELRRLGGTGEKGPPAPRRLGTLGR